jgi:hypothetical protein
MLEQRDVGHLGSPGVLVYVLGYLNAHSPHS